MSEPDASLRRIEALVAELEGGDARERAVARELLQLVLDLHGLALARMAAMIAAEQDGPQRLARLAEDPHLRAALLLYGLHPEEPAERVARAVDALSQELADDVIEVRVLAVGTSSVRVLVRGAPRDPEDVRKRIEAAVVDAAPELEELVIEGLGHIGQESELAS